jgi:hypothetical protein
MAGLGTVKQRANQQTNSLATTMAGLGDLTAPSTIPGPPPLDMSVERDPRLERIAGMSEDYVNQLRRGDSSATIAAMQGVRDASEGERAALRQSSQLRGAPAHEGMAALSGDIQRRMQRAGMETAQIREQALQGALSGATTSAMAPVAAAQNQQQIGISAYNAQNAAWQAAQMANQANAQLGLNQLMALRDVQMSQMMLPTSTAPQRRPGGLGLIRGR